MFVVGKSGDSQLGVRLSHSELQMGVDASPSVSEGALGLLIEVIVAEAAHTERGQRGIFVRRLTKERPWQGAVVSVRWQDMQGRKQRAVVSIQWQDARKECSFCSTLQRAGTQSRGAGLYHTRPAAAERQRQSAALHKSDGARDVHKCWHIARDFGPKSLKFEAKRTSFWSARL